MDIKPDQKENTNSVKMQRTQYIQKLGLTEQQAYWGVKLLKTPESRKSVDTQNAHWVGSAKHSKHGLNQRQPSENMYSNYANGRVKWTVLPNIAMWGWVEKKAEFLKIQATSHSKRFLNGDWNTSTTISESTPGDKKDKWMLFNIKPTDDWANGLDMKRCMINSHIKIV